MTSAEITQINSRFDGLDSKMNEFMGFVAAQFSKVATKDDIVELRTEFNERMDGLVTKAEFNQEISMLKSEITEVKTDVREVKEIVQRLDRRTDEDIRATMKDVSKIKNYLAKRGHQI